MKTLRKTICALLALLLLAGMLPAAALADGGLWEGPVSAEMISFFGANGLFDDVTCTDAAYYSDSWFLADSAALNYELALMSAMACGASSSSTSDPYGRKISALLEAMHFSGVERNEYYANGTSERDSIGCIIGSKTITDESGASYTLLAVFPRNAGYGNEWAGDFNLGADGDHAGFVLAREKMLAFMGQYLTAHGITGSVKVWSAGYSRGAAAANMVGGYLAEHGDAFSGVTIAPKDLFVYTIATPLTAALTETDFSAYPYSGIHNFVAYGDYVTKMPPEGWGFTRYGVTVPVEYGSEDMCAWLRQIGEESAEEVADSFAANGGGYSVARPVKTLDFATLNVKDTGYSISPDAMILERLSALKTRADFINENYYRVLSDVAAIFGTVGGTFAANLSSKLRSGDLKTGELINGAIANYLVYAAEQQRIVTPDLTDEAAVTEVMVQLLAYVGIQTDAGKSMKSLVEDGLAFLINDLETNKLHYNTITGLVPKAAKPMFDQLWTYVVELDVKLHVKPKTVNDVIAMVADSKVVNQTNLDTIGTLIPADTPNVYKQLYVDAAAYLVAQDALPRSIDDVASFATRFIVANAKEKPNGPVMSLLRELVPQIPNEPLPIQNLILTAGPSIVGKTLDDYADDKYQAMESIILDIIRACNDGTQTMKAEDFRKTVVSLIFFALNANDIGSFILYPNDPNYDVTVGEFAGNVLNLALPKDKVVEKDPGSGKDTKKTVALTLTEAADKALKDLLDAGMGAHGADNPYATDLKANVSRLRTLATTMFFRPGDAYDLKSDVKNGTTFVDQIMFLFPAHYHEMYISWLKTKVTCRVVFESSGGSAVEKVTGLSFGDKVPKPADPTREGFFFGGWYQDEALTVPWRFDSDTVQSVCTVLYARWTEIRGDAGGTPASTTVTVPVSGEDATVNVKVEIKGDTAAIKEADIDKVLEAEDVGTVSIDVSGLKASIDEVTIPGKMVDKIADAVADEDSTADGLEVRLPAGSVSFDADAVAAIGAQADGKDVTLHLDNVKVTELASAQQDALSDLEVEVVLDAYLTANGQRISDFKGGSATVKIPYTLKDGQLPAGLVVWYVAEDGTRTQVPATYDGEYIVFDVPHFSNYVVAYDEALAAECPKDESCPLSAFGDLDAAAWYHDGVHFVLANGIMNGMGDGKFAPNDNTSRAMIVTILYRMEGEPMIRSGMPFSDVTESDWYAMAVSWAESQGIVNGFEDGTFRPNDPITREQLAAVLYRYAQYKGEGFTGLWSFRLDFPDAGDVAEWATEAVSWMVMQGVINGMDGKLNPQGSATRAQAATMLRRFVIGA